MLNKQYPIAEHTRSINDVPGRMFAIHEPQLVQGRLVHRGQKWLSEGRSVSGYGKNGIMRVEIRFDDECRNGHQTFAITAEVRTDESRRMRDIAAGGCMHDEITKTFPELAPLIRWHSVSTDSPLHYVANTLYHAGDRDCNGRAAGEPTAFAHGVRFGNSPITIRIKLAFWDWLQRRIGTEGEFRTVAVAHENQAGGTYKFAPKYSLVGFDSLKWHECPFDDANAAQEFAYALNTCSAEFVKIPTAFSVGKARDLDAARRAACWPDATDEQLSAPPEDLKKALLARAPVLLSEFRNAMEDAGFLWEP